METIISAIFACALLLSRDKNLLIENLALRQQRRPHVYLRFVFQKREKNLRFFDVTYSLPIPV
jgi:hypothetical protein